MIEYRSITPSDAPAFWTFLNLLDSQTDYMMYEPGERSTRTTLSQLESEIQNAGEDFFHIALDGESIVGYLHAQRGKFNRTHHTAYIVTGVLEAYRGKGIGTVLFRRLDKWARESHLTRLELTVECNNEPAKHLYEKAGLTVEGTRKSSMHINGNYIDEYYMAKIL